MRAFTVSTMLLTLAGCSGEGGADVLTVTRYQCAELPVSAEFHGTRRVLLILPGNHLLLQPEPAASGTKYTDAQGNEFSTTNGALLKLAGQAARHCTEKSAAP